MASEAKPRNLWTEEQTLAALHVYLQLPFGKLHSGTPKIKELAGWIGRTPSAVARKLSNLAGLDPAILASGKVGLTNGSAVDDKIWSDLKTDWDQTATRAVEAYARFATSAGVLPDAELFDGVSEFELGKNRTATVQMRVNQARFRSYVLAGYNSTCCISGLQNECLLIASHIVPWSEDTHNRLNPQNGLCMSALHDRAYDQGLITVLPDYTVRVSAKLKTKSADTFLQESLLRFDKAPIRMPSRLAPAPDFLAWHARHFGYL
jgi:putative restriction endonuclease